MHILSYSFTDDEKGLLSKLDVIAEVIKAGSQNIDVRLLSVKLVQDLPDFDFYGELERIYEYVRHTIRYIRDIDNVELIHSPENIIKIKAGDCDDFAILLGSMLKSIGFPIELVISSRDGINFEHIYLRVNLNDKWIVCDPSMNLELGNEINTKYKRYFLIS